MISSLPLRLILAVFVLLWAVISVLGGQSIGIDQLRPFQTAAGLVGGGALIFERWGWKFLPAWLVGVPNLEGTWKGELRSDFVRDGRQIDPIEAYLIIRQTFSTVSIRQITRESSSVLRGGRYVRDEDGIRSVSGTYLNTPAVLIQDRGSRIHYGSVVLEVQGTPPTRLDGHYWTDRGTKGEMTFRARESAFYDNFGEAAAGHYS